MKLITKRIVHPIKIKICAATKKYVCEKKSAGKKRIIGVNNKGGI